MAFAHELTGLRVLVYVLNPKSKKLTGARAAGGGSAGAVPQHGWGPHARRGAASPLAEGAPRLRLGLAHVPLLLMRRAASLTLFTDPQGPTSGSGMLDWSSGLV